MALVQTETKSEREARMANRITPEEEVEKEVANKLPWEEKIVLFQIHPDAASRRDIARLAEELMYAKRRILEFENTALASPKENK